MTLSLAVSAHRLRSRLEHLAGFGRTSEGGITRPAWSKPYLDAMRWLESEIANAGLKVWSDCAGNVFGGFPLNAFPSDRLDVNQAVVMTGSHIDTVPNGGMFDGALGVIAGLECLERISESNKSLT